MTEAAFWGMIRSHLRRLSMRWKPSQEAMLKVRRAVSGKRHKFEYQCNSCNQWFKRADVQADHVIPAGSLKSFNDVGPFLEKLLVEVDGYQCLCSECHNIKTKKERDV